MTDPNDTSIPPTSSAPGFGSATLPAATPEADLAGAPIELNATGDLAGVTAELPKIDLSNVVPGGMPVQVAPQGGVDQPHITALDGSEEVK